MADCIDDDEAKRAAPARRALQRGLTQLRAAGLECELTQTVNGDHARISLAYGGPGQERCVITEGWAIGERDNESLAYTWMTLKVLGLVGALRTSPW